MSEPVEIEQPSLAKTDFLGRRAEHDAARVVLQKLVVAEKAIIENGAKLAKERLEIRARNVDRAIEGDFGFEPFNDLAVESMNEAIAVLRKKRIPEARVSFLNCQCRALHAYADVIRGDASKWRGEVAEALAEAAETAGGPLFALPPVAVLALERFANRLLDDESKIQAVLSDGMHGGPVAGDRILGVFDADLLDRWIDRFSSQFGPREKSPS